MQSKKPHKLLFKELLEHTSRVKMAIHDENIEALNSLAREHKYLMDELKQAGLSTDTELLDLVKKLNSQIDDAIATIREKQDEIGTELKKLVRRKEMVHAYINSIYSVKSLRYKLATGSEQST